MRTRFVLLVGLLSLVTAPWVVGQVTCPPAGFVNSAFTGATTQLGRIFRDGVASACPSKAYPGILNPGTTYNLQTFTYANTGAAPACVTVNFDPNSGAAPCGTNAHASAYLNAYDSGSQAGNFVGDVGSSATQPFSFTVPAGNDLVLVVTNTSAQAVCDFSFQVVNLPCFVGPPRIPTLSDYGLAALFVLLALAGLLVLRRPV